MTTLKAVKEMKTANQNILVVDDNQSMQQLMSVVLKKFGFNNVHGSLSGQDALDVLRNGAEHPYLIFCDLNMPGMDGVEFLRHLTECEYRGGVIIISGAGKRILSTIASLGSQNGLNILGVLSKPFTIDTMRQLVLEQKPAPRPKPITPATDHAEIKPGELKTAIEKDQLDVYLQPKVDIHSGRAKGMECLVRWIHPLRGLLTPDIFIPIAERYGLIDEVTEVVITKAFEIAEKWQQDGTPLSISINLSIASLQRASFMETFCATIRPFNVTPGNVIFEVTEGILMENATVALENLVRLRLQGFGLSIDDFGTGYSSMEQLQRVPFTELKIPRNFVVDAVKDSHARAILESTIDLARKFDLTIVAEGVETQTEWDMVAELGCDLVQGYYASRPIPKTELQPWIRAQSAIN